MTLLFMLYLKIVLFRTYSVRLYVRLYTDFDRFSFPCFLNSLHTLSVLIMLVLLGSIPLAFLHGETITQDTKIEIR